MGLIANGYPAGGCALVVGHHEIGRKRQELSNALDLDMLLIYLSRICRVIENENLKSRTVESFQISPLTDD